MATHRSNRTNHWLVEMADGESWTDKCRDSFGGFCNMVDRMETRLGTDVRFDLGGVRFTAGGRSGTVTQVNKL